MMTHRQISLLLGISRQQVQLDEKRALAKLAVALDLPTPRLPGWMLRHWARATFKRRCSRCRELGHNARGCVA